MRRHDDRCGGMGMRAGMKQLTHTHTHTQYTDILQTSRQSIFSTHHFSRAVALENEVRLCRGVMRLLERCGWG